VRLHASAGALASLADCYDRRLQLPCASAPAGGLIVTVGQTAVEFVAGAEDSFYHFALLVPGNRFDRALEWAARSTSLLPHARSGKVVFDFSHWSASACYFHDPAGNIVELIAHRGLDESSHEGPFRGAELLGLSELGLVGDPIPMARALEDALALRVWDGSVAHDALAFVGERAHTLILAPAGRGWLPTGRPSQRYPVEALISGAPEGEVALEGSHYRISRRLNVTRLP
jgi:hypothetical protein